MAEKNNNEVWIWVVIAVLFFGVVGIMLYFILSNKSSAKPTATGSGASQQAQDTALYMGAASQGSTQILNWLKSFGIGGGGNGGSSSSGSTNNGLGQAVSGIFGQLINWGSSAMNNGGNNGSNGGGPDWNGSTVYSDGSYLTANGDYFDANGDYAGYSQGGQIYDLNNDYLGDVEGGSDGMPYYDEQFAADSEIAII